MSVYSTDSLEEPCQRSPKYLPSSGNDTITHDTGSNETALRGNAVRRVPGGRNAIIANSGFAIVSPGKNRDEEQDRSSRRRSSRGQKLGCSLAGAGEKKRAEKKLGSVHLSRIQPARKERSYLEVYRRRFDAPSRNTRSSEDSSLLVLDDNRPGGWSTEEEEEEERDCSPMISGRENRSELGWHHRLTKPRSISPTVRSLEITDGRPGSKHSAFNRDKSERRLLGYKPYTVEEYRALAAPARPDRSLGPDRVEIQAKREWLIRRRSYGNFVSARNRQQILMQTQRLKSRRDAAKECFLPPLQDRGANAKAADDSSISAAVGAGTVMSSDSDKRTCEYSNKPGSLGSLARKSKNFDKASSFCSPLNSCTSITENLLYPKDLRERRQPYEKCLLDRVPMRKTLSYARNGCLGTVLDAIRNGYV